MIPYLMISKRTVVIKAGKCKIKVKTRHISQNGNSCLHSTGLTCRRGWYTNDECFIRRINQWQGILTDYLSEQQQKNMAL